jgi:hypothetical protein
MLCKDLIRDALSAVLTRDCIAQRLPNQCQRVVHGSDSCVGRVYDLRVVINLLLRSIATHRDR